MAGHALRELESVVRQTLATPLETTPTPSAEAVAKVEAAERQLQILGFDKNKIDAALDKLTPRPSHNEQIEATVTRLGLAADGDIARAWKKLTGAHGKAHGRAFYTPLTVDETLSTKPHKRRSKS
jgi:hypothetical protein